jgi:two-component system, OmpR family, torCAD operon response regulator TorR
MTAVTAEADHVLIVEDDATARSRLSGYLEVAGYRVSEAADADTMRRIMAADPAELLLVDINLPGEDGLEITRALRAHSDVGIILVTGRADDVDRIVGLELGADDYVTKPFNARELLVRVRNLLRRVRAGRHEARALGRFGPWRIDYPRRRIQADDGRVESLTRAEFEILSALLAHPNQVMPRDRLHAVMTHRGEGPGSRTVDVLVRRLRRKVESDPSRPDHIITVHGEGYLLAVASD